MSFMWSCDFILLPHMAITIKMAKSGWFMWCYISFWLVFFSRVQKCHLHGHVNSFYCHIWQLPSNWLNLVDLYDVIYHSDWFFELSSEMSCMWSCDFILLPYMAITIKLAKSYWYIWCYILFWPVCWAEFRSIIYVVMWLLSIAIWGNYYQIGQILLVYIYDVIYHFD
jgi:hypothetical protein